MVILDFYLVPTAPLVQLIITPNKKNSKQPNLKLDYKLKL